MGDNDENKSHRNETHIEKQKCTIETAQKLQCVQVSTAMALANNSFHSLIAAVNIAGENRKIVQKSGK